MWNNLPFDLLANIFSYLSPDSLARAKAACRSWRATADMAVLAVHHHYPPWFVALPTRSRGLSCYIHNSIGQNWHVLPLDHISSPIRPIATIGGLILVKITGTTYLQLAICNPFTRQFRALPMLNVTRTNPAVGLVENDSIKELRSFGFKIYVAGGMSEAASSGGAVYQSNVEIYDSDRDTWQIIGSIPIEFSVRLTVWTPNQSVYSKGILYWMTSARAYSVMGFEIETNRWRELSVPMADRLEFAALVPRNGNPTIIGGTCGGDACIWELGEGHIWNVVEKLPIELGIRLLGDKPNWGSVKCVGIDGAICLYRDIGAGVIIWKEVKEKWEWDWIEGCRSIRGKEMQNFPIKGLLIHPNISHFSSIF
ncbi:hypothetical protein BUALT_Bualt07G0133200 [Buddleja alternifolia]|uniref:F-box domain-containing protein n=1 Tax=Buddleja alternifolia TaxID=168488 RepID=A0AAV6XAG1_9LAMI|nr:hypothetical protein BUALT_Bualt07G0133200 [Buddleja alternifolia]